MRRMRLMTRSVFKQYSCFYCFLAAKKDLPPVSSALTEVPHGQVGVLRHFRLRCFALWMHVYNFSYIPLFCKLSFALPTT